MNIFNRSRRKAQLAVTLAMAEVDAIAEDIKRTEESEAKSGEYLEAERNAGALGSVKGYLAQHRQHGGSKDFLTPIQNDYSMAIARMIAGPAAMDGAVGSAMDYAGQTGNTYLNTLGGNLQLSWYSSQSFIGSQACAILGQNWFIDKACKIVPEDAVRPGYKLTTNSGKKLTPEVISDIMEIDERFNIKGTMKSFGKKNRLFGVRVAIFKVKSKDKMYYQKPFNIDGVTEGSYEGILQVDPMWCMPILDAEAAGNPASMSFYEPTWWQINGTLYHKSHLVVARFSELPDILKPEYIYGGIPLSQLIMQRVYAAESSANEAPELLETMRTFVLKTDTSQAVANSMQFDNNLADFIQRKNNQGVYVVDDGDNDDMKILTTSLTDVDEVINGQFDLACAPTGVPASKMMVREVKGGLSNENGQDDKNYAQVCANEQDLLSPLLKKHHQLVVKSFIEPNRGAQPHITHEWNPVDTPSAKEKAEVDKMNMETATGYVEWGILAAEDVADSLQVNDSMFAPNAQAKVAREIDYEQYEIEAAEYLEAEASTGFNSPTAVVSNGI